MANRRSSSSSSTEDTTDESTQTAPESVEGLTEKEQEILTEGQNPDLQFVQADAAIAAAEQDGEQHAKDMEQVGEVVAAAVPYAGPTNLTKPVELSETAEAAQKFNDHLLTNPGLLVSQVGQVDTSGTAGRTDAASNQAVSTVFSHPARLAQQAVAKEFADSESPDAKLGAALREAVAAKA